MINIMGKCEYMKFVAGAAAALTTKTGKIGFLGPLINDETRRLASSAYLGAKYAWATYLKKDPAKLEFKVTWIGFWFNIPGVTSDPTQVADDFFNSRLRCRHLRHRHHRGRHRGRQVRRPGQDGLGRPLRLREGPRREQGRLRSASPTTTGAPPTSTPPRPR